jgi:hypothetical protein
MNHFYLGKPNTMLEWDMKLWWAHNEAMIAFLMAFKHTNNPEHWQRFKDIMEYCAKHVRFLSNETQFAAYKRQSFCTSLSTKATENGLVTYTELGPSPWILREVHTKAAFTFLEH